MNYIFLFISLISSLLLNDPPHLTIKISNIEKINGEIKIGIFDKEKLFLKEGAALKNYSIKVDSNTAFIIIKDLPKGEYAVSMYHDENSDNQCNRNFMGIPTEGYGFSNNIKPKFSAPKYNDCKFKFLENTILTIKMIY